MNRSSRSNFRPNSHRRGVTLVEMLVTVAVLVIIMTILVQVFQAATGAVSGVQALQQIDDQLRRIDGTIRSDLGGATAHFTPPLDPVQGLGYFEYGENEFADIQGEDSDDYIRFTAKAPPGQPFTGRMWVPARSSDSTFSNPDIQPVTISSDYAEIIYFLRNGNLYRRILLIAPNLQSSIYQVINNQISGTTGSVFAFYPSVFGNDMIKGTLNTPVSWQGVNDLSARPAATGTGNIVLNSLSDLTNRENRFAYPRFANDFWNATTQLAGQDGIPDDLDGDNVPDLYPTFYSSVLSSGLINAPNYPSQNSAISNALGLMAFPYVFPGAYSKAQLVSTEAYGWIHTPLPNVQFDSTTPLTYLRALNHNPLDVGDNLPAPSTSAEWQTWWGFPTWRETLSPYWSDPTIPVYGYSNQNIAPGQPSGLVARSTNSVNPAGGPGVLNDLNLLPPMFPPSGFPSSDSFSLIRRNSQLFCDADGGSSLFWGGSTVGQYTLWSQSWEDDLIMTGVRSFDVKAYDNALANYADLGWGDDLRNSGFTGLPFLAGNPDYSPNAGTSPIYPPQVAIQGNYFDYINQTFAHEGRMPPLINDNRLDAQYPNSSYITSSVFTPQYANFGSYNFSNYSSNIGDNDSSGAGIVRLRRVWDSWSTNYSRAPANGVYNNSGAPNDALNGFPWGPPFTPPVYPSFPPPYPAPLRGIQIQIRVVDPSNQRIKSLTIRQDFTDKL